MKRILWLLVIAAVGWYGYQQHQQRQVERDLAELEPEPTRRPLELPPPTQTFQCDGREYCSQMTSCAEATFFIRNCPGAKMDGNNDGVPCEKQWCL